MSYALTANRLADGEVVFWTGALWSERFAEAKLFEDVAEAETAESEAKRQITQLIDPYLIEVMDMGGRVAPVSFRERLRALGPTNRTDHGKQAAGGAEIALLATAQGAARSKGRVELIRRK
jgi:sulfite reductase (NADPH) hemoprotein beta-component